MLTGRGKLLESYVRNRFGVKVRSVELNVNQRCSSLLASLTDINEADMAGRTAVKCALEGVTGKMITFNRTDNNEYSLEYGLVDVCVYVIRKSHSQLNGSPAITTTFP